jgi:tRNA-2-methylthio-N6-dimethylallyladenosine synthase
MSLIKYKTYFIKTFGCAQNTADSERIKAYLEYKGLKQALNIYDSDYAVINTCMIRQMAEDRVYGLIHNLESNFKLKSKPLKIVVTGCMVGMIVRDKTGKLEKKVRKKISNNIDFLPIEEIGFDNIPIRSDRKHALVPISNGCNNFCSFCVVPFTRGMEVSRPYDEIIKECSYLDKKGYKKITLLGMNVNSYGSDMFANEKDSISNRNYKKNYFLNSKTQSKNQKKLLNKPVYVKHLGRYRIPTLFPSLLEEISRKFRFKNIDFLSSNPWDFSPELIDVIQKNRNISRDIHLPVQSGSNTVLKRMNRWYTAEEYGKLYYRLKKIKGVRISTDIIVGFCQESEKEFQETISFCKKFKFYKAYIAMYSDRPNTYAHKNLKDDVSYETKKIRWAILDRLVNSSIYNE